MNAPANNEELARPTGEGRALRTWSAPVLTVGSVGEVTRSGDTSSNNDGSSNYAPS